MRHYKLIGGGTWAPWGRADLVFFASGPLSDGERVVPGARLRELR